MKQYNVIIPTTVKPYPDMYEVTVARILAEKFRSDVIFIERSAIRTPDVQVIKTKQFWEFKNIKGNGKMTIEDNLRKASKQSDNIVVSLLRSKMSAKQACSGIWWFLEHAHVNVKRVILVTKDRKTIDFYA